MVGYIFCVIRAACVMRGKRSDRDRQESQAQETQWVRDSGENPSVALNLIVEKHGSFIIDQSRESVQRYRHKVWQQCPVSCVFPKKQCSPGFARGIVP